VFILSFSISCFFKLTGLVFYNVFILCCRISNRPIAQVNEHIFEEFTVISLAC
jgi:hypothetical protein